LFFGGKYETRWLSEKQANWLLDQWEREAPEAMAADARAKRVGAVYGTVSQHGQFLGTWTLRVFKHSAKLEFTPYVSPEEGQ
jgi:hypothetical protein